MTEPRGGERGQLADLPRRGDRRSFLRAAGVAGAVVAVPALIAACSDDDDGLGPVGGSIALDFANDSDILNYAYALEQLEAAFYTQVIATPYGDMTNEERTLLTGIRDHEIAHREFLRRAITNGRIDDALTVDFSSIDFGRREEVLGTAKTFEDLGVRAYNGAGQYLDSAELLTLVGKIVSVEARHAAAIAMLIGGRSADFTPDGPLDEASSPSQVLAAVRPYLRVDLTVAGAAA